LRGFLSPVVAPEWRRELRSRSESSDPVRWMKHLFKKHGVPHQDVSGRPRATEAQYRLLMDKCTCSPSAPAARRGLPYPRLGRARGTEDRRQRIQYRHESRDAASLASRYHLARGDRHARLPPTPPVAIKGPFQILGRTKDSMKFLSSVVRF
jgi:hypothetical protein